MQVIFWIQLANAYLFAQMVISLILWVCNVENVHLYVLHAPATVHVQVVLVNIIFIHKIV
jgi:hypothetical protein